MTHLPTSRNKAHKKENGGVTHPDHYNQGIEMWDYASSHNLNFFEGNVIKYITRWKDKNGLEDLHKAKQYLDKFIEIEEVKVMKNLDTISKDLFDEEMFFSIHPDPQPK